MITQSGYTGSVFQMFNKTHCALILRLLVALDSTRLSTEGSLFVLIIGFSVPFRVASCLPNYLFLLVPVPEQAERRLIAAQTQTLCEAGCLYSEPTFPKIILSVVQEAFLTLIIKNNTFTIQKCNVQPLVLFQVLTCSNPFWLTFGSFPGIK